MTELLSRRKLLAILPASFAGLFVMRTTAQTQAKEPITVYKDPTCGCCHLWVEHAEANGFKATVIDGSMPPVRARFGIPANLASCHTVIVRGYIIEGHVPASDVKKLLAAKTPGVVGLTIPGMPASAPG